MYSFVHVYTKIHDAPIRIHDRIMKMIQYEDIVGQQ